MKRRVLTIWQRAIDLAETELMCLSVLDNESARRRETQIREALTILRHVDSRAI